MMKHSNENIAQELEVDRIIMNPDAQVRASIDEETVNEYAEIWKAEPCFPPLDVFFDGTNILIADGAHRYFGALKAGLKKIQAVVHKGTARDAFIFAAKCNTNHGLRRTNKDKRYLVAKFLQDPEWSTKSSRWIADACLVSHTFVENLRNELATVASLDIVEGRDGKFRPARMYHTALCGKLPQRLGKDSIELRQELCTNWWDQLGKYVLLLTAAGWEPQNIADFLGMSLEDDIKPILNPRLIKRDDSEFVTITQKPDLLAKAYREVVKHSIHFHLGNRYMNAASTADNEGFPELKEILFEHGRLHDEMAKKLRNIVCPLSAAKAWWPQFVCVDICARKDARLALGIEKDPVMIQLTKLPLEKSFKIHLDLGKQYQDESIFWEHSKALTKLSDNKD